MFGFRWREGALEGGWVGILTVSVHLKYTTSPLIRPRRRAPGGCNCRCVPVKLSHYQRKLDGSPPIRSPPSDQTPQKERLAGGTPPFPPAEKMKRWPCKSAGWRRRRRSVQAAPCENCIEFRFLFFLLLLFPSLSIGNKGEA